MTVNTTVIWLITFSHFLFYPLTLGLSPKCVTIYNAAKEFLWSDTFTCEADSGTHLPQRPELPLFNA